MLSFLVALTTGISPLLRGAWDLWAQGLIQLLVLSGFTLWLAYHFSRSLSLHQTGIFTRQNSLLFIVAAASGISTALSLVTSLALPEWRNLLLGLWILLVSPLLVRDKKNLAERVLHVTAWILFALALYQRLVENTAIPASSLVNPNAFACFLLMILPLAVSWKDWPLFGATILALSWSASWGAWLALAITAIILRNPDRKKRLFRLETAVLAAAAIAITVIIVKRGYLSIDNRLVWWEAAVRMLADKPFLGFGTGTFAYVFPAYHEPAGELSSLYAHNWPLQFTAENGILCGSLWLGMVIFMAHRLKGAKKWAVTAAFIHSFVGFGFSIPSNFWLFCFLLGSPASDRALKNGSSMKKTGAQRAAGTAPGSRSLSLFVILVLAAFSSYAGTGIWKEWKAGKLTVLAQAAYAAGDEKTALERLDKAGKLDRDNAGIPAILGRIYLDKARGKGGKPHLLNAAAFFERAVELNPFRPGDWAELARVYGLAGEKKLRDDVFRRRDLIFKYRSPPLAKTGNSGG